MLLALEREDCVTTCHDDDGVSWGEARSGEALGTLTVYTLQVELFLAVRTWYENSMLGLGLYR